MKKHNKHIEAFKRTTIIFGYGLFAVQVLSLFISRIVPWVSSAFDSERQLDVPVLLILLVTGVILPPVVSYIMGYRATNSILISERRFNGVLLGIASYWISQFFGGINSGLIAGIRDVLPESLAAGWPSLLTIALMAAVALHYSKSKNSQSSLLENRPYQIALFAGLLAILSFFIVRSYYSDFTLLMTCVAFILIPSILILLSYKALLPASRFSAPTTRLTMAVIAVGIGFISSAVAAQLLPGGTSGYPILVMGGIVLAAYLLLARRTTK